MSKLAATLASLLLIASSIGVNIARYPQVGRALDTGQRTAEAENANPAPAAQPSGLVGTANPDALPARETRNEPAKLPQVTATAPVETAHAQERIDPKPADDDTARSQPQPAVPILNARPLVPIAGLQAAAGATDLSAGSDQVQRLPPVEASVSAISELETAGPDEAQSYTSTSTP